MSNKEKHLKKSKIFIFLLSHQLAIRQIRVGILACFRLGVVGIEEFEGIDILGSEFSCLNVQSLEQSCSRVASSNETAAHIGDTVIVDPTFLFNHGEQLREGDVSLVKDLRNFRQCEVLIRIIEI